MKTMYCMDNGTMIIFSSDKRKLQNIRKNLPTLWKHQRIKHIIQAFPSIITELRVYDRTAVALPRVLGYSKAR